MPTTKDDSKKLRGRTDAQNARVAAAGPPDIPRASRGFVRSLRIGSGASAVTLELAYPTGPDAPGCINVICGLNNCGKTYIIRHIRKLLGSEWRDGRPTVGGVVDAHLTAVPDGGHPLPPRAVTFTRTAQAKAAAGKINIAIGRDKQVLPRDFPNFRRNFLNFLRRQMVEHVPAVAAISDEKWLDDAQCRRAAVDCLAGEETAYRCSREDTLVADLEGLLRGSLFFRRARTAPGTGDPKAAQRRESLADQLELLLGYADGTTVPFDEWSDGQKVLFYVVTQIALLEPELVLLDEIENHLHPEYITRLLDILKRRTRQAIIATHHPHVIFSEYVDCAVFLERKRVGPYPDPPATIPHVKGQWQGTAIRTATSLRDGFDRVTAAYKLFDHQDNQLLQQAQWLEQQADLEFYKALRKALQTEVARPTGKVRPDKQTDQLAAELRAVARPAGSTDAIVLLDLGAGVGRVLTEISKVAPWRTGGDVRWTCWEPMPEERTKLRERLRTSALAADVPDNLEDVPDGSVDVCVIANVVHELTPEDAAELLCVADRKRSPARGVVVILELYPLLRAEKLAVPFSPDAMRKVLNEAGMNARCHTIPVLGGSATAYCVVAERRDPTRALVADKVSRSIAAHWKEAETMAISSYAARHNIVRGLEDYRAMLQDLTVIASVAAWRNGCWRGFT